MCWGHQLCEMFPSLLMMEEPKLFYVWLEAPARCNHVNRELPSAFRDL